MPTIFNENRCVICGGVIPEGRMVCKICERTINTAFNDCQYFYGSYICSLTGTDCIGGRCKYLEKTRKEDEI